MRGDGIWFDGGSGTVPLEVTARPRRPKGMVRGMQVDVSTRQLTARPRRKRSARDRYGTLRGFKENAGLEGTDRRYPGWLAAVGYPIRSRYLTFDPGRRITA